MDLRGGSGRLWGGSERAWVFVDDFVGFRGVRAPLACAQQECGGAKSEPLDSPGCPARADLGEKRRAAQGLQVEERI